MSRLGVSRGRTAVGGPPLPTCAGIDRAFRPTYQLPDSFKTLEWRSKRQRSGGAPGLGGGRRAEAVIFKRVTLRCGHRIKFTEGGPRHWLHW